MGWLCHDSFLVNVSLWLCCCGSFVMLALLCVVISMRLVCSTQQNTQLNNSDNVIDVCLFVIMVACL